MQEISHALCSGIGLCAKVTADATTLKVTSKEWLEEAAENDLGTASLGKGHPKDEDKLEGVVEGKPVDSRNQALDDGEEGKDDPVGQPLGVIGLGSREQGLEGVVGGDDETGSVDKKLASNVEEDEEEVQGTKTEDHVDLRNRGLLLEVLKCWIL